MRASWEIRSDIEQVNTQISTLTQLINDCSNSVSILESQIKRLEEMKEDIQDFNYNNESFQEYVYGDKYREYYLEETEYIEDYADILRGKIAQGIADLKQDKTNYSNTQSNSETEKRTANTRLTELHNELQRALLEE